MCIQTQSQTITEKILFIAKGKLSCGKINDNDDKYKVINSTYLAAWTPSQVVLSLIRILSLLIPAFSYSSINFFALSIEPSTSNDNLQMRNTSKCKNTPF